MKITKFPLDVFAVNGVKRGASYGGIKARQHRPNAAPCGGVYFTVASFLGVYLKSLDEDMLDVT
jgi:hypothetical protein